MIDLKTAHERAFKYAFGESRVMRMMLERYLTCLEANGYVIAPVEATEEMQNINFVWPVESGRPYAEMVAARPKLQTTSYD